MCMQYNDCKLVFRLDTFILRGSHTDNDLSKITNVNAWICYKCKDDIAKLEAFSSEVVNLKTMHIFIY